MRQRQPIIEKPLLCAERCSKKGKNMTEAEKMEATLVYDAGDIGVKAANAARDALFYQQSVADVIPTITTARATAKEFYDIQNSLSDIAWTKARAVNAADSSRQWSAVLACSRSAAGAANILRQLDELLVLAKTKFNEQQKAIEEAKSLATGATEYAIKVWELARTNNEQEARDRIRQAHTLVVGAAKACEGSHTAMEEIRRAGNQAKTLVQPEEEVARIRSELALVLEAAAQDAAKPEPEK